MNQVASDLGVKPEEVLEMESRLANFDESFEPVTANDDGEFNYSPSGYLSHGELKTLLLWCQKKSKQPSFRVAW